MILFLHTATPVCQLSLKQGDQIFEYEWESGRELASGLLGYIQDRLAEHDASWKDIDGIVAYQGPGSFTGLRIGLTVLNTFADAEKVPIIGATDETWKEDGLARLLAGEDDKLVMPHYGGEPNITQQRK